MESEKLCDLVDFDDGFRDILVTSIEEPRMEVTKYKVGQSVITKVPGFKGKRVGIIAALSADRDWLKKVGPGPRPVSILSKGTPQPKQKKETPAKKSHSNSKQKLFRDDADSSGPKKSKTVSVEEMSTMSTEKDSVSKNMDKDNTIVYLRTEDTARTEDTVRTDYSKIDRADSGTSNKHQATMESYLQHLDLKQADNLCDRCRDKCRCKTISDLKKRIQTLEEKMKLIRGNGAASRKISSPVLPGPSRHHQQEQQEQEQQQQLEDVRAGSSLPTVSELKELTDGKTKLPAIIRDLALQPFTEDDLRNCSITGKKSPMSTSHPRPPLDAQKLSLIQAAYGLDRDTL